MRHILSKVLFFLGVCWLVCVCHTGHWDLRDQTVDMYKYGLDIFFERLVAFRERHPGVQVMWSGVPPYSHQHGEWGGKERRTNLKIMLGDRHARALAAKHGIIALPFFELALPFYRDSCDSHHYLCFEDSTGRRSNDGQIGMVHASMVLSAVNHLVGSQQSGHSEKIDRRNKTYSAHPSMRTVARQKLIGKHVHLPRATGLLAVLIVVVVVVPIFGTLFCFCENHVARSVPESWSIFK